MSTSASATPASWDDVEPVNEPEATADPADSSPPEETAEASQPGATDAEPQSDTGEPSEEPAKPEQDPAATAEKPKAEHRPFAFTVDRTRREVPGAIETPDGWIAMPRNAWDRHVQPNLRDPEVWKRERAEYQRQIAERDPERSPVVQQAKLIVGEIQRLRDKPEDVVDWALGFINNLPVLEARAEAAAAKRELTEHRTTQSEAVTQQQVQELAAELPKVLLNEVTELLKAPEFAGLGLNAQELAELGWELRHSIFFEADEDSPEENIRKGEILYRKPVIRKLVEREANAIKRARKANTDATAARKANDAVLNPPPTPPAVGAKHSPAPAGKKAKTPSNYDEWERSLSAKD